MSVVSSIYDRELGNGFTRQYGIALGRLKCRYYDTFCGISPYTEGPDYNPEPPLFACSFCTTPLHEHLLALANEDGKIAIQDTNLRSNHVPFEGYQAHHNAIFDIAWVPGEMRLVSASGDHSAALWNVAPSGQLQEVSRFRSHTRTVKTVAFPQEDKMIFATGARDGVIMLWDTRTKRSQTQMRPDNFIVSSFYTPGTPGSSSGSRNRRMKSAPSRASSITGLVFQDAHHLISCGAGDGKVKVWDLRKSYSTYRREPKPLHCLLTPDDGKSGFTCLSMDPSKLKLYASCADNTIYGYNISTYEQHPVCKFSGHKNGSFYVKACLSPDGRYLLSGSTDENAYIWDTASQTENTLPLLKLVGHSTEVTCVAWCPVGDLRIVTCSDDSRHCLWRVGLEHEGDDDKIELFGWVEAGAADPRASRSPGTPVTPATPSFTSLRKWASRVARTPDSASPPVRPCNLCSRLSTPCMRCLAAQAGTSGSAVGSKKRLAVLWEEVEVKCPECERESKQVLATVSSNGDMATRRLFSPKKLRMEAPTTSKSPSPQKRTASPSNAPSGAGASPRKSLRLSGEQSPQKYKKERDRPEMQMCSPNKRRKVEDCADADECIGQSESPSKRVRTPLKRRISERPTNSPHKRLCDDLQGISKIDDCGPSETEERRLCARHRRASFSSPTLNLPNYVVDGTSPHHSCSPVNNHKENVDWLTRLRRERNSTEKRPEVGLDSASTPPAKSSTSSRQVTSRVTPGKTLTVRTPPTRTSLNRSGRKGSKRKISNSETLVSASVTTSTSASQENLLKFFRVSRKSCEQQCVVEIANASHVDTTALV